MNFEFENKIYKIDKFLGAGAYGIVFVIVNINNNNEKKTMKCYI